MVSVRSRINARLVIRAKGGHRYEFSLTDGPVMIGRSADCALVLDDQFVSRHHARIDLRGDQYLIADRDSRNGVLISGSKIERPHILAPGDEFQIGSTVLTYLEGPSDSATALLVPSPATEQLPSIQVDAQKWEVLVDGQPVTERLSTLEFKLLAHLSIRAGAVCTRHELGALLWGENAFTYEMLHQVVHRLKRRLKPYVKAPSFIATVPGVGYKLRAGGADR